MNAGEFLQLSVPDPVSTRFLGLAGAGTAVISVIWFRQRRRRDGMAEVPDAYKTRVVEISETPDSP